MSRLAIITGLALFASVNCAYLYTILDTVKQESKEASQTIKSLQYDYREDILTLLQGRKDVSLYVELLKDYETYALCASIDTSIDCQFVIYTHTDKDVLEFKAEKLKKEIQGE